MIEPQHKDSGWSDDREQELVTLWLEGYTGSEIAEKLGRTTRSAVLGKVRRMELTYRIEPSIKYAPAKSKDSSGPDKVQRSDRSRWHLGMNTIKKSEARQFVEEPTKNQLREMLSEAVRNTQAMMVG